MEFRNIVKITLYVRPQDVWSLLDSVTEGESGMIWENDIETCIISYLKQIANVGLMHGTGFLGLVHWDDPEVWDGECGGRGVQYGENMHACG